MKYLYQNNNKNFNCDFRSKKNKLSNKKIKKKSKMKQKKGGSLITKKKYDLIILVIASESKIYNDFINNYWIHFINYIESNNYSIKVYLIYGNSSPNINLKKDNILKFNIDETQKLIMLKTIKSFEYIEKYYNYKFVLRTNLSSFFILPNIFVQMFVS